MRRVVPWLLLLAAAGVVLGVLLRPGQDFQEFASPESLEEFGRTDGEGRPTLAPGPGRPEPRPATGPSAAGAPVAPPIDRGIVYRGRVLSSQGSRPLAGAEVWLEPAQSPCGAIPRAFEAPVDEALQGSAPAVALARARCDAQGRFELSAGAQTPPEVDLLAWAAQHTAGVACRVTPDREVEIVLTPAHVLRGRVSSQRGDPVAGVSLYAVPADTTPKTLAHAAHSISDEQGNYVLGGVAAGSVHIVAHHPLYMPHRSPALDPVLGRAHDIVLVPALRLTLHLRSEDGRNIENPVLHWRTRGQPPQSDLRMLIVRALGPEGMERSELEAMPVKLPCSQREVDLELKADGYAPWRSAQPLRLPPEGGSLTQSVTLERDDTVAALHLRFEDDQGMSLSYAELGAVPYPTRLDGMAIPSGIVVESRETLTFPSLPAGPWRIQVHCARYAPAAIEVELVAGSTREERVVLREPARLRLSFRHTFLSEQPVLVRFVLLKDGRPVPVFPESGALGTRESEVGVQEAGTGHVFTGLAEGTHVVEVRTPGLAATRQEVRLRAGEVEELEIEVQRP